MTTTLSRPVDAPRPANFAHDFTRDKVERLLLDLGVEPLRPAPNSRGRIRSAVVVAMLNEVLLSMADEPKRFDMRHWVKAFTSRATTAPSCGMVLCLAGWVVALNRPSRARKIDALFQPYNGHAHGLYRRKVLIQTYLHGVSVPNTARLLLGLNEKEADILFHIGNWPLRFRGQFYRHKRGTLAKVIALRNRVQHFINTGE